MYIHIDLLASLDTAWGPAQPDLARRLTRFQQGLALLELRHGVWSLSHRRLGPSWLTDTARELREPAATGLAYMDGSGDRASIANYAMWSVMALRKRCLSLAKPFRINALVVAKMFQSLHGNPGQLAVVLVYCAKAHVISLKGLNFGDTGHLFGVKGSYLSIKQGILALKIEQRHIGGGVLFLAVL